VVERAHVMLGKRFGLAVAVKVAFDHDAVAGQRPDAGRNCL
jgi:hypothetical protein